MNSIHRDQKWRGAWRITCDRYWSDFVKAYNSSSHFINNGNEHMLVWAWVYLWMWNCAALCCWPLIGISIHFAVYSVIDNYQLVNWVTNWLIHGLTGDWPIDWLIDRGRSMFVCSLGVIVHVCNSCGADSLQEWFGEFSGLVTPVRVCTSSQLVMFVATTLSRYESSPGMRISWTEGR